MFFKNAGIGYIHIFIKTILALLKSTGTGPHDPIPTFKKWRSEAPEKKKCRDRNFDHIPALFETIPALFKTLG